MAGLPELPRITQLSLAVVNLPDTHPAAPLGARVPVYGYCIHHPDGPILVDTGVGYGNPFIDDLYHPQRHHLEHLLTALGVEPDTVSAVINTHLHFDHCGQNPALFNRTTRFYAQADELLLVDQDPYYTDPAWALAPAPTRRTVHGDESIADGITILATPGHTPGHQSVLVEGGNRRVVIGGQLVWQTAEIDAEHASPANVDPDPALQAAAVDSIRRIKALHPEIIHLSHCDPALPPP